MLWTWLPEKDTADASMSRLAPPLFRQPSPRYSRSSFTGSWRLCVGSSVTGAVGELCFGTVDSWLLYKLTDGTVHATEPSNASRTLVWNIREGDWDDLLLAELQVLGPPPDYTPPASGCARCADFPTPESCYVIPNNQVDPSRVWASAQSCIQRCHNNGCVPLDCRYLGTRAFPTVRSRHASSMCGHAHSPFAAE